MISFQKTGLEEIHALWVFLPQLYMHDAPRVRGSFIATITAERPFLEQQL